MDKDGTHKNDLAPNVWLHTLAAQLVEHCMVMGSNPTEALNSFQASFPQLGDSRKYPYLYHRRLLGFPKGRRGSLNLNSKGMGEYLRLEIQRHGGISQGGFLE